MDSAHPSRLIGIFGGTFDPVHIGHVNTIVELKQSMGLSRIMVLPAAIPNLRISPHLSAQHRLHLLRLALQNHADISIDDRELNRKGITYSVDTLGELTAEKAQDEVLLLIMGSDAFMKFHLWKDWRKILQLAHLVVMHRPGWEIKQNELAPELAELLAHNRCDSRVQLKQATAGRVRFETVEPYDISATKIRQTLAAGESIKGLVPTRVSDYISQQGLFSINKVK